MQPFKHLKRKAKPYKLSDRDGMYVYVSTTGSLSFRYDYRINGGRETLVIGKYGHDGISLAAAPEKCIDARRAVREGRWPAQERQREKRRLKAAKSFTQFGEKWFRYAAMADSTRAMRRSVYDRDIAPFFNKRLLHEIKPDDLRQLCLTVKERGAPATAIHVRDIIKQISAFAILHGE